MGNKIGEIEAGQLAMELIIQGRTNFGSSNVRNAFPRARFALYGDYETLEKIQSIYKYMRVEPYYNSFGNNTTKSAFEIPTHVSSSYGPYAYQWAKKVYSELPLEKKKWAKILIDNYETGIWT